MWPYPGHEGLRKKLPKQSAIGAVGPGRDRLCHERYASGLDSMVAGCGA